MCMQSTLANCVSTTCKFDLWMSKGMHDIFVVVVSFVSNNWEAKHATIGFFEMTDTCGITMIPKVQEKLDMFTFMKKHLPTLCQNMENMTT